MPENGEKTVQDWQPKHQGCSVLYWTTERAWQTEYHRVVVRWVRPPVKGLDRVKFIEFGVFLDGTVEDAHQVLDLRLECHIDRIVHADSLKLLARGKRSQTADQDRFDLSKRAQNMRKIMYEGETLCPA